jgi:aspartate dehydrogenase
VGAKTFRCIDDLIAWRPTVVAECAGHDAVRELAPSLLAGGVDVVVASIGALCDGTTRTRLKEACAAGRSRVILTTGAVGGLDALAAARLAGLDSVLYIARKPPQAWSRQADLAQAPERSCAPAVVFEGSAGEAARLFPQNANVAAAIALAGLGFAGTEVRLLADPGVSRNVHEIQASGTFGELWIRIANEPFAQNPKTSQLAALSVERAIRERVGQATWSDE